MLVLFLDFANVWGVDYDSSIDDSNKIRSSTGVAMNWISPIGPMSFVLATNLSKASTDVTQIFYKKDGFYVQGHFPGQPVMPGVLIVEAFGQAAAALTAAGIDKKEYENKLVFLMSVEKARFRNPVIPDCKLELNIEAIRSHGRVWKYKGEAFVDGKKMADAQWSATIVDRK